MRGDFSCKETCKHVQGHFVFSGPNFVFSLPLWGTVTYFTFQGRKTANIEVNSCDGQSSKKVRKKHSCVCSACLGLLIGHELQDPGSGEMKWVISVAKGGEAGERADERDTCAARRPSSSRGSLKEEEKKTSAKRP